MTNASAIPSDWSEKRQAAARWFIADVTKMARMIVNPDAVNVDVEISESGQISVTAESRLYYAFGCCFIGPRGGILHRRDHRGVNF